MKTIILAAIRLYQKTSVIHTTIFKILFLGNSTCRFTPTCSRYTYEAVEKYGSGHGLFLGIKRVLRCHPWSKGGHDPVL